MRVYILRVLRFFNLLNENNPDKPIELQFFSRQPQPGEERPEAETPVVLVGPNGSGKSNVLRCIKFMAEQYPLSWRKEDNGGSVVLKWRNHGCWDPRAPSSIELVCELSESERLFLARWRLIGLLGLVRNVAKQLVNDFFLGEGDKKKIQEILKSIDTSYENRFIVADQSHRDPYQVETLKRALWELLKDPKKNPFGFVIFKLATYETNYDVARFQPPKYVSNEDGQFLPPSVEERHCILSWFCERLGRGPPAAPEKDYKVVRQERESEIAKLISECPRLKKDAEEHFNSHWHAFMLTGMPSDPYHCEEGITVKMKDDPYLKKPTLKRNTLDRRWDADEKKYWHSWKLRYDGSAIEETRKRCPFRNCRFLKGKQTESLKITNTLLPRIKPKLGFMSLKQELKRTIEDLTAAAYPAGSCPILLKKRTNHFVAVALLRSSLAFLQQDRSLLPTAALETRAPLAGLLDLDRAHHLALQELTLNREGDACKALVEGMRKVLNVELGVRNDRLGKSATEARGACCVRPLTQQIKSEGDWVEIRRASGGQQECFMVLMTTLMATAGTIILDEPGHSLHPESQRFLCQFLQTFRKRRAKARNPVSIIIVTHSPEYISLETFPGLIYCRVDPISGTGCPLSIERHLQGEKDSSKKHFLLIHRRLFFSSRVLFVEGISDLRVVECILALLEVGEPEDSRVYTDIISLDSCGNARFLPKIVELFRLPFLVLLDIDALFCEFKQGSLSLKCKSLTLNGEMRDLLKELGASTIPLEELFTKEEFKIFTSGAFERSNTPKLFNDLAAKARAKVWELSGHRVYVLPRDLEHLFLPLPNAYQVLSAHFNQKFASGGEQKGSSEAHDELIDFIRKLTSVLCDRESFAGEVCKELQRELGQPRLGCSQCVACLGILAAVPLKKTVEKVKNAVAEGNLFHNLEPSNVCVKSLELRVFITGCSQSVLPYLYDSIRTGTLLLSLPSIHFYEYPTKQWEAYQQKRREENGEKDRAHSREKSKEKITVKKGEEKEKEKEKEREPETRLSESQEGGAEEEKVKRQFFDELLLNSCTKLGAFPAPSNNPGAIKFTKELVQFLFTVLRTPVETGGCVGAFYSVLSKAFLANLIPFNEDCKHILNEIRQDNKKLVDQNFEQAVERIFESLLEQYQEDKTMTAKLKNLRKTLTTNILSRAQAEKVDWQSQRPNERDGLFKKLHNGGWKTLSLTQLQFLCHEFLCAEQRANSEPPALVPVLQFLQKGGMKQRPSLPLVTLPEDVEEVVDRTMPPLVGDLLSADTGPSWPSLPVPLPEDVVEEVETEMVEEVDWIIPPSIEDPLNTDKGPSWQVVPLRAKKQKQSFHSNNTTGSNPKPNPNQQQHSRKKGKGSQQPGRQSRRR
ncbi:MAG: AAA family ATPase [Thermoplasmata archaeon]|uniref:AAA family ATPase n=1 Tax=Candidatus Sysuiplasma superficiale TaxID=2823368 RepID=A0A8J7YW33_9ARCH|nr:AAA family ATPase [Candidatus Sysuiplasma superficiale]